METETQLWTWFLFGGVLKPQRAKTLLSEWESRGLALQQVVRRLPSEATALGLTYDEAARLHPHTQLPETTAVRWNEPLYPHGLRNLPFKLRPALLFYSGEVSLLARPIIYFAPGELSEATKELLLETVGMFIGENLLLAAFEDSPQAAILLEELSTSEGEGLLLSRQGLNQKTTPPQEQALLAAGRLLKLTPLPPDAQPNVAWNPVLERVALAAATRCVFSSRQSLPETQPATPSLLLTPASAAAAPGIHIATNAAEALTWLLDIPATPTIQSGHIARQPATSLPGPTPVALDIEPPPTPGEMLRTLEKGGNVPDVLRRRLLGDN